jgi:5'-nucleotidase
MTGFGAYRLLGRMAAEPVEAARATVARLRDEEKVDVVIALSEGGLHLNPDGSFTEGADVLLAVEVPRIDVVGGAATRS